MAKNTAKKTSKKAIVSSRDKMKTAAIAAVIMEMECSAAAAPSAGVMKCGTGRDAWKMAGRAERLGIGSFGN